MKNRHKHNLSNLNLTTANMGELIPVNLVEALPGDTFQARSSILMRLGTLNSPVMHKVNARLHHFFVPHRLGMKKMYDADTPLTTVKWNEFITGGDDGLNSDVLPTISTTGTKGDLFDKFGFPLTAGVDVSLLPVAAYNLIYNEYFRDQDLSPKRLLNDVTLAKCAWEKDYFSTCRPWTQKGAAVSMPLAGTAPVATDAANGDILSILSTTQSDLQKNMMNNAGGIMMSNTTVADDDDKLYADLSQATGASIIDLRRSIGIQRMAEARAQYGSRLIEYLAKEFGARPQDFRLQRPEYLGGGQTSVSFSEVLQTAPETTSGTSDTNGVGDLYGHGIANLRSNKYRRTIPEHGYIITLLSVRPKTLYMNGIDRTWLRTTKEDFYTPQLEHIGQQEVFDNEIFADAAHTSDDIFGYQDRYREYKEANSKVSGDFRDTLNFWHLGRDFASSPTLNDSFVQCEPSERIFAQSTADNLMILCQNSVIARRVVSNSAQARII